jgi:hypothetical protein
MTENKSVILGEQRVTNALNDLNYFLGDKFEVEGKEDGEKVLLFVNGTQVPFSLNSLITEGIEEVDKRSESMLVSVIAGELKRYVFNFNITPKKKKKHINKHM